MSAEDAHYAALRKFGGIEHVKEECRDAWSVRFVDTLFQDIRFGAHMLTKNLGVTAVAILSLALGIGANIALFSVMNVMLLRALPVQSPQELVEFVRLAPNGTMMSNLEYAEFEYLQKNTSVLSGIFGDLMTPASWFRKGSERAGGL